MKYSIQLFKGTGQFLQLKEYLHKNFKGKKGPVLTIRGVLLKLGVKRPLFTCTQTWL